MSKLHTRLTLRNNEDLVVRLEDVEKFLNGYYRHDNTARPVIDNIRAVLKQAKVEEDE